VSDTAVPQSQPLTHADLRSPRWLAAHLGIVLLVVVFVLLGRWQWHSGHKVVPLTQAQLAAWRTPQPAASLITADGVDGAKIGQAAEAAGTYDASRQLLVPGRTLNGHTGYYVIAPLVTGAGQAIVVNRGWLPAGGAAQPAVPAPPSGRVTVTGWAAESESATGAVNQNGIAQTGPSAAASGPHEVSVISAAQLVNQWPYHLPDGYLSATDAASASGGLTAIAAPLPAHGTSWDLLNVSYAFQWCLFAVVTVGWYLMYWRRELRASGAVAVQDADSSDAHFPDSGSPESQPAENRDSVPEVAALAQRETGESTG
jgi:cytochrome oxidase assembly protein ShyY1